MTNFQSKHVALLKNKKDCADIYCVTLIENLICIRPCIILISEE